MLHRLLRLFGRRRPVGRRPTPGEQVRERKADAQLDLLAGKGLASGKRLVDFERDSKAPGSESRDSTR